MVAGSRPTLSAFLELGCSSILGWIVAVKKEEGKNTCIIIKECFSDIFLTKKSITAIQIATSILVIEVNSRGLSLFLLSNRNISRLIINQCDFILL